ncbi:helix-turn-helix transcriptional regulator [Rhizobium tumorigenes]|uniref:helix-turn-helix transcriptional regulator n=1 Tax=Rhizobium tumorigenes TaxID=2041385 RepID=UPI00241FEF19|nr:hypothetical protein [Rhizobium tumorigenes]WFS02749.1 hypothetical protein PR016_09180 [Rhizobium tumorigenes]
MSKQSARLIGRKEAAEYCGITPTCFSMWVASHKMPASIPGTRKWDRRAIDAKLDETSGLKPEDKVEAKAFSYEKAQAASEARREKEDHPRYGLERKLEQILVAMSYNEKLTTLDVIPGAGPVMIRALVQKKLVAQVGTGKAATYSVSDEGNAEAIRIFEQWKRR